jgi:hypothetical protein
MGIQIRGSDDNISASDGSLTINGASFSTLQVNGQNLPTAGPLSNRNLIINGAMAVHQRGSDITATGYIVDRWRFNAGSLDQWAGDATWETDAPAGFSRSIKMNTTTAETSFEDGDELSFEHRIEAQNLQHLDWGTANAKSLTLSFWVKCNKTGTQSIHVRSHDASDGYSTSYSINSADTWEYKTIVIPGNTAGSINNDTGIGIWIRWIAADGNIAVTEDAWDTSNIGPYAVSGAMTFGTTIGDYLQLAGVQLEVGSVATPFEHRSYGDELDRCERYFQLVDSFVATGYGSGVGIGMALSFRKQMRASPSLSVTGVLYITDAVATDYVQSSVTGSISSNNRNERGCRMAAANFSGLTDYRTYQARPGLGGEIQLSAEL